MSARHPTLARVLNEPATFLMWPRAALMQLAVESVSATEIESGSYGMRGARRWSHTVGYLRVIAHGDAEEIRFLVRDVNHTHAQLHVPPADRGAKRRPSLDPEHQLWVATTWFVSIIDAYEIFVAPLDDQARESLYAEFTAIGNALQMRPADWPADVDELLAYHRGVEDQYPIAMTRSPRDADPSTVTAADIATQVFPAYSLKRRYLWLLPRIRLLTWGMASERMLQAYGVEWSAEQQTRFERTARRWRRLYHCWPGPLRRRTGTRHRTAMMAAYYARAQEQQERTVTERGRGGIDYVRGSGNPSGENSVNETRTAHSVESGRRR